MFTVTIDYASGESDTFNHTTLEDAVARYTSLTFGLRSSTRITYICVRNKSGLIVREWRPQEFQQPDRPTYLDKAS